MYRNHDARRLEHLTVLLVMAIVLMVGAGALLAAQSLSHTLKADSRFDTGDPAAQPPPTSPSATITTTSTSTPPTTDSGPIFTPSTDTSGTTSNSGLRLQMAGQAVASGTDLRITIMAQASAPGRGSRGLPIAISNNNQCTPGEWSGFTDRNGQATTSFTCAMSGADVSITATSGTARAGLMLHR